MHKIDGANNANGSFAAWTVVTSDWLNAIQMEIINVIQSFAGMTLDKSNNNQLSEALGNIFSTLLTLNAVNDLMHGANVIMQRKNLLIQSSETKLYAQFVS